MTHPKERSGVVAWTATNAVVIFDNATENTYRTAGFSATDFAVARVGARLRIRPPTARLIVELAGLGGRS